MFAPPPPQGAHLEEISKTYNGNDNDHNDNDNSRQQILEN